MTTATSFPHKVLLWLRAGYPEAVPGPDRVPLMALLCTTSLTADEMDDVVRRLSGAATTGCPVGRDEIDSAIAGVTGRRPTDDDVMCVERFLAKR